jgi:hypothetical protein
LEVPWASSVRLLWFMSFFVSGGTDGPVEPLREF